MLQTKATSWVGSIFQPFISLLVKIWHWNKSARSKLNPVHSSKSRSTTCTRLGRLFRFQWNSTPTSDDCVLSFKTILAWVTLTSNWNQSLQPKQLKMKLMKDDIRKPCRDLHWLGKLSIKGFLWAMSLWKSSSTMLLTNHLQLALEDLF